MQSILAYRIGAWSWIVCGAGHSILDIAMRLSPTLDEERVDAVLRDQVFALGGISRSSYEVMQGISLAMGVAIVTVGVLLLCIGRLASSAGRARPAVLIGLVASVVKLGLAGVLMPSPPIVLFSLASVAFGIALVRGRPRSRRRLSIATVSPFGRQPGSLVGCGDCADNEILARTSAPASRRR